VTISRRGRRAWPKTIAALGILAVLLFPLYWMFNASLEPSSALFHIPPMWFPDRPTLAGYRSALDTQLPHLATSLIIAGGTVALTLVLATPAAYALAHFRMRFAVFLMLGLLLVQVVPGIVIANSLYSAFTSLHLVNTYWGLILADSSLAFPFAILILRAFMESLPRSITEAARVDGAGYWRILWSIILPLSRNAVVTAALFSFLFAWADFLYAITLTNSATIMPITVSIYQYIGVTTADWNSVMASAVVASVPAGVLLIVAQRYIAAGITGGAVKE